VRPRVAEHVRQGVSRALGIGAWSVQFLARRSEESAARARVPPHSDVASAGAPGGTLRSLQTRWGSVGSAQCAN
jgi:hypothetical protein